MVLILTHHGLDLSQANCLGESRLESFQSQLQRGYSLEADLNFTKDGIILCHDSDLRRLTRGKDLRTIKSISTEEASQVQLPKGRLGSLEELMHLLRKYPKQMIALHFKGDLQTTHNCDALMRHLKVFQDLCPRTFIIGASINTAKYLKQRMPELQLAAFVSHSYDIERFFAASKGTLLSLENLLSRKDLYAWAWLDEWDLMDRRPDGRIDPRGKEWYTAEIFALLRQHGFAIGLVTPELHAASTGQICAERHPHASPPDRLFARIEKILRLRPDAVCTNHPEEVRALVGKLDA